MCRSGWSSELVQERGLWLGGLARRTEGSYQFHLLEGGQTCYRALCSVQQLGLRAVSLRLFCPGLPCGNRNVQPLVVFGVSKYTNRHG